MHIHSCVQLTPKLLKLIHLLVILLKQKMKNKKTRYAEESTQISNNTRPLTQAKCVIQAALLL